MNKIGVVIILLMAPSLCYASDNGNIHELFKAPIAVEFRVNNKFKEIVGKLELDYGYGDSISIITFSRNIINPDHVLPLPTIYKIILKDKRGKRNYYVRGENQYGVMISGIIDVSSEFKPKIDLMLEGG